MCYSARVPDKSARSKKLKVLERLKISFEAITWEGRWRERWSCLRTEIPYFKCGRSDERCRNICKSEIKGSRRNLNRKELKY